MPVDSMKLYRRPVDVEHSVCNVYFPESDTVCDHLIRRTENQRIQIGLLCIPVYDLFQLYLNMTAAVSFLKASALGIHQTIPCFLKSSVEIQIQTKLCLSLTYRHRSDTVIPDSRFRTF